MLAGDFNDWFWPGSVRKALTRVLGGRTRYRTFPAVFPLFRFDRIYCRPREVLVRSFVDRQARALSDHLPVIADLRPICDKEGRDEPAEQKTRRDRRVFQLERYVVRQPSRY